MSTCVRGQIRNRGTFGNSVVRAPGIPSTKAGSNVVGIAATAYPTIGIHYFRIYSQPVVVIGGYPRFQYGGYWFSLVDPWPEYWSDDWYDRDDVSIEYFGDGYYMYNRRYPGDRIAVNVYVN
jgi:hypothetical protein